MSKCEKCGGEKIAVCPICGKPVEVYSRVVGYHRPVNNWNIGKREEYSDRLAYDQLKSMQNTKYCGGHKHDDGVDNEEVRDKEGERPE